MRGIFLVMACMTCVGHARRVQPTPERHEDASSKADAVVRHQSLPVQENLESNLLFGGQNPSEALKELLLALEPSAGFKSLANLKPPTIRGMIKRRQAKARFADKKLVVITGTSSGLGRATAAALLSSGKYHVVGAVRDLEKMKAVAEEEHFPADTFTPLHLDLNSFESVRSFVESLNKFKASKPVDRLICNAAVYQPTLPDARWSEDGHEQQMQTNFLSHYLLVSLLLPDMARASDPRVITVGEVTGNDVSQGAPGIHPIADLKKLEGLKAGAKKPISMLDGLNFDGPKAYKDSKLALMMLTNMLHERYHRQTGIAFSSVYPGSIAESSLFRDKEPYFKKYYPLFMKYTNAYVSQEDAGQRLFQAAHDPRCSQSGVSWLWKGVPQAGLDTESSQQEGKIMDGGVGSDWDSITETDQTEMILDKELTADLWKHSALATGAEWPVAYQPKSPCPTLKVIGAITTYQNKKEEMKRMKASSGLAGTVGTTALGATATITDTILSNTIGRVSRIAQRTLLGRLPEEAVSGSYQETKQSKKGLLRRLFSRRKSDKQEVAAQDEIKEPEATAPQETTVQQEAAARETVPRS